LASIEAAEAAARGEADALRGQLATAQAQAHTAEARAQEIERRAGELELAAELELEPLIPLQRDVTRLKSEALARFSAGELEGRELMSGFLTHANDVRDYLARLILHVRQLLEQQADAEGRSVRTVWKEEAGNAATIPPATGPADAEPGAA
jgi:hypothetical protein